MQAKFVAPPMQPTNHLAYGGYYIYWEPELNLKSEHQEQEQEHQAVNTKKKSPFREGPKYTTDICWSRYGELAQVG